MLVWTAALLGAGLALALLLGVGVIRQGSPVLVAASAGALVLLPALGLAGGIRAKSLVVASSLAGWALLLLAGFPLYFPGERAEALNTGLSVIALPLGLSLGPDFAASVDEYLPGVRALRPPPAARKVEAVDLPAAPLDRPDQVALPYEGEGRTLSIPITVDGPRKQDLDIWMMFDTGATLTTLDRATLDELGVRVPPDAPEVTVQTAAGPRNTRLALVDRVWVGGLEVSGVTVSVCDDCRGERTRGLLGLNVSGRFLSTVDPNRQEIVLEPHDGEENRVLDIIHWATLSATATRWPDGRVEVEVRLKNRAARQINWAEVSIRCSEVWSARLTDIGPGQEARTTVSLPAGADCAKYAVALDRAGW